MIIIIISYTQTITNLLHLQIITVKSNYRLQNGGEGGGAGSEIKINRKTKAKDSFYTAPPS